MGIDRRSVPKARTLPAAGEHVKGGTPVDIFFTDPKAAKDAKKGAKNGVVAVPGGGGSGPKDIAVPAIGPADQQGYGAVLAKAGLVTAGLLWRSFRYALLLIFIVAAVITPTGDMVTQTIFAAPMVLLYVLSILIAWVFGRARLTRSE